MGDSLHLGGKVSIIKDLSKHQRMKFLMFLGFTLCLDFALANPLRLLFEIEMQQMCLIKECEICEISSIFCCPGFTCENVDTIGIIRRCKSPNSHCKEQNA